MHTDDQPLSGMKCRLCGTISVPVQTFGCERCGSVSPDFMPTALSGNGRVRSAVTVSEHPNKSLSTPLAIGTVVLDEGIAVRSRLEPDCRAGDRVEARAAHGAVVFCKTEGEQ
ncbi:hypothetical protein ASG84_19020 [Rhodococcus sp. Leaf278]|uniref:Zn-ribbon domain-containing OB-fold protein n=1 Tax=Rhodococcus sp. Leaf278 TaxID=1736319 RepID=UPI000710C7B5|nr:OB-fold domain-containing protein [Rhodococcus sp. Leaf278]KQU56722.1 hypothetical protein ASG84_19020 [Rhodococcus sp. Leaf278]